MMVFSKPHSHSPEPFYIVKTKNLPDPTNTRQMGDSVSCYNFSIIGLEVSSGISVVQALKYCIVIL